MPARWVYTAAAGVLVALVGLASSGRDLETQRLSLANGAPAVLQIPAGEAESPEDPRPLVVLFHGRAGNSGQMGSLARRLARSGYAVLRFDLPGHGGHPHGFAYDGVNRSWGREFEAAFELAVERRDLDAERIALVGYGLGGSAALQEAQWDPARVASVAAISPPHAVEGPYAAPNALLLWGARDATRVRREGRAIGARLAGRTQIVAGRTYGDPAAGEAVRIGEVDGVGRLNALYSRKLASRLLDWLDATLAPSAASRAPRDPALGWSAIGLLAALVLLWALPVTRAPARESPARSRLVRLGTWGASLGIAAALVGAATAFGGGPLAFLSLAPAREIAGLWGVAGGLAWLLLRRPTGGSRAASAVAGLISFAMAYALFGSLLSPWIDLFPSVARLGWTALLALILLPHFAALESGLRDGSASAAWLPAVARALALAALPLLVWTGLLSRAALTGWPVLLAVSAALEVFAARWARDGGDRRASALAQALCVAWILGALLPLG